MFSLVPSGDKPSGPEAEFAIFLFFPTSIRLSSSQAAFQFSTSNYCAIHSISNPKSAIEKFRNPQSLNFLRNFLTHQPPRPENQNENQDGKCNHIFVS